MTFKGGVGDCPVDAQRGTFWAGPAESTSVRMLISLATGKGKSAPGVPISKSEGVWRSEEVGDSRVGSVLKGVSAAEEGRTAGDSGLGL